LKAAKDTKEKGPPTRSPSTHALLQRAEAAAAEAEKGSPSLLYVQVDYGTILLR
jgi:hypothetical protein